MKPSRTPHIEIILPVANDVKNVLPLLNELDAITLKMREQATFSLLFIEDASHDGSRQLLRRLFKERTDARIIELVHPFGRDAAVTCGLEYFEGDAAMVMGNLKDSPAVIPEMFVAWQQGAKTVIAEAEKPEAKGMASRFLKKVTDTLHPLDLGIFCLLDRNVVLRLKRVRERSRNFRELVIFSSAEISRVKIDRPPVQRALKEKLRGLWALPSQFPAQRVSRFSIACSLVALTLGFVFLGVRIFANTETAPWTTVVTLTCFGFGLQLLCLGLLGGYIAHTLEEVKHRPLYLIDRIYSKKTQDKPAQQVA